ncbi:MAG TPA: hypothetical protein VJV79_18560 [Polyangiaceae bacterium]|nr:hypothetical protein [Polyangiaceae bacterium]
MSALWACVLMVFSLLGFSGCAAPAGGESEAEPVKSSKAAIINGVDNRLQYGTHPDASLRTLARYSTAAMVAANKLNVPSSGPVTFNAPTLQAAHNLCGGQRFATEQTPAHCSATLIDDQLMLTSSSCFAAHSCADTRFVFNYYRMTDDGAAAVITAQDVFSCQEVLREQSTPSNFAIVKLDRVATPGQWVAPVRKNRAALAQGSPLAAIGFPGGTAVKIASGGIVRAPMDPLTSQFLTNVDAFAGNAGGGLYYTESYELAGIINPPAGADYVSTAGCNVPQTCTESGCGVDPLTATSVGAALNAYCESYSNPRLCETHDFFSYSSSNGAKVHKQEVFLAPGDIINLGTCDIWGGTYNGDTTIELDAPDGRVLMFNDDSFCGLGSWTTYTVPPMEGGRYQIVAGCYLANDCSGTVAYTVKGARGGTLSYTGTNTNSAQQVDHDVAFSLGRGQTLTIGTCGLDNTGFSGDTYLRLYDDPSGATPATQLAYNDDACGGYGSQITYTAPSDHDVRIKFGCYLNEACTGTLSWTIGVSKLEFAATNTSNAQLNTQDYTIHAAGAITIGSCGLPGAVATGDTFIRLFSGSTEVAASDDACDGAGSRLSYRAPPGGGDYTVRLGCYSNSSCSGTAVVRHSLYGTDSLLLPFEFNTTNTASATRATANHSLYFQAGDVIGGGTCPQATFGLGNGTGDTFLRLFGPNGLEVAQSDNNCASNAALSSIAGFSVSAETAGAYELRAGCAQNAACSGRVGMYFQY